MKQSEQAKSTPDHQAANTAANRHDSLESSFVDQRPAAATQRKLSESIEQGPHATAQHAFSDRIHQGPHLLAQRKQMAHIGHTAQLAPTEEEPLQSKSASAATPLQLQAEAGSPPNNTGLPDKLKSGIENLSGMSMDGVKVHYNSSQPEQLNAHAYAQGTDIHVAPGQEQHLPHEAWHVVQQAQGRVQPTMQMKEGVPVNDDRSLEHEADVMGGQAAQRKEVTQRATPEEERAAEEKAAWFTADHVHGNMLLDAGHISGSIIKKAYLWGEYKDLAKRKRIAELATKKLHLIDKNMYGRGKIGAVMRNIDTASRIMHLIGSISGVIALAANIAAFFAPAALPVGAIAGVIALAAHSAMAVLQTILIGRNLYRIRGLPEAEKAKILPTLYRDIAKLGFSLLGVITGGVGLGGAMQSGGLMAHHALEGAEAAAHGGHLAGDIVGDTIGTYAMGGTIAHQNEKEIAIGMAGGLDHHAHKAEPHAAAPAAEPASDGQAEAMQADLGESTGVVSDIGTASQDAIGGADGLASDVKPLEELSAAEPKAQQALAGLAGSGSAIDSMPKMKEAELDARSAQVGEVEDKLGMAKSEGEADQQQVAGKAETVQQVSAGTTQMQATAQREGKPGVIKRAIGWLKKKFTSFKNRVRKVIGGIQAKLTELVLKLAGVKNLPVQMGEALAEQRIEAAQVMDQANAGRGALAEWKSVADKIGKKK